ncbi:MAG TPA: AzlC family ABC transporter permease [Acidimicrobiia bacterium]|nr:AzlC family ABC transporter permease [Acidimicrobiia bacterium]
MSAGAAPSTRAAFTEGVRAIAPIVIGVFPFGLIAGVAAVEAGLTTVQALAASPMIFAGASQLAAMDLIGRSSPALVIVLTAWVINARFAMYSAALTPPFASLSVRRRAVAAYLLTDQAFAMSTIRFARTEEPATSRYAFYLGSALTMALTWHTATIVGVVVGTGVPPEWSLDFAVPLVFIALVFPAITDRATRVAAITAAIAASSLRGMPLNLGLLTAALIGIVAGLIARGRQ